MGIADYFILDANIVQEVLTLIKKLKDNFIIIPLLIVVVSIFSLIFINYSNSKIPYKNYNSFLQDINNTIVQNVETSQSSKILITLKDGNKYTTDNPNSLNFKEDLLKKNVQVTSSPTFSKTQRIPIAMITISTIVILYMAIRRNIGGNGKMSTIDNINSKEAMRNKYNFDSVAGNEEAKESLNDIVDFLKNPEKYNSYGARMPKGIILYGEPGTGKTLLAKAIAGEAQVPFYAVSGSDFVQMYVGVGASRIRNLFKKAKAHGKAVIFIDEIDAIGKARSNTKNGNSDEKDQTLNALLTEMSGFNESYGIVVIAATNRLDILDPALLRPGRFDRHIEVSLPDVSARERILNLHLKNKPIEDIDVKALAQSTAYFSGAKLESLTNEAAILACKDDSPFITNEHFNRAYSLVIAGYDKVDRTALKDKDIKITAYHEIGHALLSLLKVPEETLSKVTIIPTSKGAGGYTLTIGEDNCYHDVDYLRRKIMVLLGGRAAEEIILGEKNITTGAYNDLKKTTNIINNMVCEYGMGTSLGLLRLSEMNNLYESGFMDRVVLECKTTLDELYEETKSILSNNLTLLHSLAKELITKETLYASDIEKIFIDK